MITLQGLAELILKPLGLDTDAHEVEVIKQRVLAYRQRLIQQDFSRNLRPAPQLIQAFDVSLTEVQEDNDRFSITDILPKPIILNKNGTPFVSVHTSYKGRAKSPLHYVSPEEVPYIKYRKFTKKGNYYTFENDRIEVFSETPSIRVRAIWDSPIHVLHFAQQETFKLNCSNEIISSPCTEDDDVLLEETMAAAVLTFFNPNANTNRRDQSEQDN